MLPVGRGGRWWDAVRARLAAAGLALVLAGCSGRDQTPPLKERAAGGTRSLDEADWLGAPPAAAADAGVDAGPGATTLPAPGRPWTVRCPAVIDHLAGLLRAAVAADGATAQELSQLDRRAAQERDGEIARCAARATDSEVECLLAAHSAAELPACRPR